MGLERKSAGGLWAVWSSTTRVSTFSTGLTTPRDRELGRVQALLCLVEVVVVVAGLLRKVENVEGLLGLEAVVVVTLRSV